MASNSPADELAGIAASIRARYPSGPIPEATIPLPDLTPILHARDMAAGKVAAIGTVNPRPAGFVNNIAQAFKRWVARALDWHVREQVEFNRAAIRTVDATLDALNEFNHAFKALAGEFSARHADLLTEIRRVADAAEPLRAEAAELKDIRTHWSEWRIAWEQKVAVNEVQFLRSVADLQRGFQHHTAQMEASFRDLMRAQHTDFSAEMARANQEIQARFWQDLEKIRLEYEAIIYNELRAVRQRYQATPQTAQASELRASAGGHPAIDYLKFAERFRGSEDYVRRNQQRYVGRFQNAPAQVLDLGCGRGEFLDVLREAGIEATGVDLSGESVTFCRNKGLSAVEGDLFTYLESLPEASLGGIFCGQVIEHLPPDRLPTLVRLAASRLRRHAWMVIETPNPECLAIFATHFYIDPTHTRPVPPQLLVFYYEEAGLGQITVDRLSPAAESMPALASLPADFREAFFGGLDYAAYGRKL